MAKKKETTLQIPPKFSEEELVYRMNNTDITLDNIKALGTIYLESVYHLSKYQIQRKLAIEEHDERKLLKIKKAEANAISMVIETQRRVKLARVGIRKLYDGSPEEREKINIKCKEDVVWWINCFIWGFDPRMSNLGVSTLIPHILFPAQERLMLWIEQNYNDRQPMLIEKSRAWGVTECVSMFNVHHWLYYSGFIGGFGSRKEELVDSLGDPNTIFGKIRRIIYKLPMDMRPSGYVSPGNAYDNRLRLTNPDNNSIIVGEGGDNMGRGSRSSLYSIDEKCAVEHQEMVDTAVSYNTNCQIDISTPSPEGQDAFYRKRMSGKVQVFTAGWWLNPMSNLRHVESEKSGHRYETESDWYKYEVLIKDKFLVASQVDINYMASITDSIIPAEWVTAAIGFELEPQGTRAVGYDLAAGGSNKTIAIHRHGPIVYIPKVYNAPSIITNFWQAVDDAEKFRAWVFSYDLAGIGKSAHDMAEAAERRFKFRVNGVLGNASAGEEVISSEGRKYKEKFRNFRARLWWRARERFRKTFEHVNNIQHYTPSEMISIPDDPNLVSQLSAVRMVYSSGGKFGAESKDKMRARGVESPDYADALIYSLADDGPETSSGAFNYKEESDHIVKMDVNWEQEIGDTLVSLYMIEPGNYVAIGAVWNPGRQRLKVYSEWDFNNCAPDKMKLMVYDDSGAGANDVKEWIANKEMFDFGKDGESLSSPYFLFHKNRMPLKRNYSSHEVGSLMVLSRMFEDNRISINEGCSSLVFQMSNWNMRSKAADGGYYYAECLAQIITRLKTNNVLPRSVYEKEYGNTYVVIDGIRRKVV